MSSEDVLAEIKTICQERKPDNAMSTRGIPNIQTANGEIKRIAEVQMYVGDTLQRRAKALHQTADGGPVNIRINTELGKKLGLETGDRANASMNGHEVVLPVVLDDTVADNCALIYSGCSETAVLGTGLENLNLARV